MDKRHARAPKFGRNYHKGIAHTRMSMDVKPPEKLPPAPMAYVKLNIGVYAFILVTTWLMTMILGSSRGLFLFAMILAGGFTIVSWFDYLWLRMRS